MGVSERLSALGAGGLFLKKAGSKIAALPGRGKRRICVLIGQEPNLIIKICSKKPMLIMK